MSSAWVERRATKAGARYRVKFRVGGRESVPRYAGAFRTAREARIRRDWVAGELAAMRVPDLAVLAEPTPAPTIIEAAKRWQESRVDVAEATRVQHRSSLHSLLPLIGTRRIDDFTAGDVADLVAELAKTRKKETIRKMIVHLAMLLDHAGVSPNPARGVKLPWEEKRELQPPAADHVEAVYRILPSRYRLPLLVLDATGMRLGELEGLAWGDVDEARLRWRVSAAVSKTSRARWVNVPPTLFQAVRELVPRDDRTAERPVFQGFGGDRFRTAITRACTATGVPAFSPHDLRHRRISLLHLGGVPWARIGEHVGQRNLAVTANTYSHVLTSETELDYEALLGDVNQAEARVVNA
jgi:integrase